MDKTSLLLGAGLTRRRFGMTMGAAVASAGLIGRAQAAQIPEFWHYWGAGGELEAAKSMVDAINAEFPQTPVAQRVIPGSAAGLRQQLQAARLGGTPPIAAQSNPGAELQAVSASGALMNINDVWDEIKGDQIYPDSLRRIISLGSDHFALPICMSVIGNCFYNKKLFDKLGLTEPTTWDEFRTVCEKIKDAGVIPLGAASPHGYILQQWYGSLLTSLNEEEFWAFAHGDVPVNGPKLLETYDRFAEYMMPYFDPNWSGARWSEVCDRVMKGEIAMFIVGDWASGYMAGRGWVPGVDYDFFAGPGLANISLFQTDVAMAMKGDKPEVVKNFMRGVASPAAQVAFNKNKGSLATTNTAPTDFYDAVGKKEYQIFNKGGDHKTLPNPYGLLPVDFIMALGEQLERYAATRDKKTFLDGVNGVEEKRKSMKAAGKFVNW